MKKLILALVIMMLGSVAQSSEYENEILYTVTKHVAAVWADEKECSEMAGTYIDEICYVPATDRISVRQIRDKSNSRPYLMSVRTIGTNGHMCDFQGEAWLEKYTFVSEVPMDYEKKNICRVEFKLNRKGKGAMVTSKGCSVFCGANASLEIREAKPVD